MIWEQHPAHNRYKEEVFRDFFRGALDSGGAFAAVDRKTGMIVGSSRYLEYDPDQKRIEIGWTVLARSHWGGNYNREMKRLMLDHAFQFVDIVVFVIGSGNIRSQKAVQKIGAVEVGRRDINYRGTIVAHVVYQNKKPI